MPDIEKGQYITFGRYPVYSSPEEPELDCYYEESYSSSSSDSKFTHPEWNRKNLPAKAFFGKLEFKPIEWLVLEKDGNTALLVSRYLLDSKRFATEEGIGFDEPDLSIFLNRDFLVMAFTEEERQRIVPSKVLYDFYDESEEEFNLIGLTKVETADDSYTMERVELVFSLSLKELLYYFKDEESRRCCFSPNNSGESVMRDYWLRNGMGHLETDDDDQERVCLDEQALYVNRDGAVETNNVECEYGIRPVMRIALQAFA